MHKLWYQQPAANWNEALPLGNGFMGAMCFAGTLVDRFQLNDDTVWSGGYIDRVNPEAKKAIPRLRQLIQEGHIEEAEDLAESAFVATPEGERAFQPLCDLVLQFKTDEHKKRAVPYELYRLHGQDMRKFEPTFGVEHYHRQLTLDTGEHEVSYSLDGIHFSRKSFISYPDRVLVIRMEGSSWRAMLRRNGLVSRKWKIDDHTIGLEADTGNGGVHCCCIVRAIHGVSVGDMLHGTEDAILIAASATDFRDGADYVNQAIMRVCAAEEKGYEALYQAHVNDVSTLMSACELQIDAETEAKDIPTDARMARARQGVFDADLINTLFAYGRYLLIASSRPGSLPANLQGIWNESFFPAWDSKFTININLEMNYWPAEVTNLSELHTPLFDLIRRMVPNGREVAREMYGRTGWMAHHNTDIWADCAPQDNCITSMVWQMGGAWLSLHLWEHYRFTLDTAFLREAFPIMEEAARFFLDEENRGELYRVSPSLSPENTYRLPDGTTGCICDDAAMDHQILYELIQAVIEAGEILGEDTAVYRAFAKRLYPVRIAEDGRLQEWLDPLKAEIEPGHRHVSHLFAIYPGNLITAANTEWMKAASKSLEERLSNGGGHTGWSRAWIIHFWARLLDGERAGENVLLLLECSTLDNLFDNHPPFQIDGNFGFTSGIAEMLLQSHEGFLRMLPALPSKWRSGHANGLCARGGYIVDIAWENGKLLYADVKTRTNGILRLQNGKCIHHGAHEVIHVASKDLVDQDE